jgi:hypothetical protein
LIREKDNDPERVAAELRIEVEGLTLPSGTPSGCIGLVGRKPVVALALYHRLIAASLWLAREPREGFKVRH